MSQKFEIKNANEMNIALSEVFNDLRSGKIDTKYAIASAKVCDAITRNLRNQLEYKKLTSNVKPIEFLD